MVIQFPKAKVSLSELKSFKVNGKRKKVVRVLSKGIYWSVIVR